MFDIYIFLLVSCSFLHQIVFHTVQLTHMCWSFLVVTETAGGRFSSRAGHGRDGRGRSQTQESHQRTGKTHASMTCSAWTCCD